MQKIRVHNLSPYYSGRMSFLNRNVKQQLQICFVFIDACITILCVNRIAAFAAKLFGRRPAAEWREHGSVSRAFFLLVLYTLAKCLQLAGVIAPSFGDTGRTLVPL